MAEPPGAGSSRSYKIRGHSRQRHSTKPYARPKDRKKTVLETVKDFFSPSWLVDFFQGTKKGPVSEEDEGESERPSADMVEGSTFSASNLRVFPKSARVAQSSRSRVGNGKLGDTSRVSGQGYFSVRQTRNDSGQSSSRMQVSETVVVSTDENSSSGEEERLDAHSQDSQEVQQERVQEQSSGTTSEPQTPALFSDPGAFRRPVSSLFANTSTPVTGSTTAPKSTLGTSSTSLLRSALAAGERSKGPQRYTLSTKRPSFSVTAFGSPLPPNPSQSGVIKVHSSPFYRGKTAFGGASSQMSSFKRRRTSSPTLSEINQPERKQIKPTPVTASGAGGLSSQTAKRILEALEGMSSPLIDARKIPSPVFPPSDSPLSFSPSQRKRPPSSSKTIGTPHTLQAHFGAPPVDGLSAPQRAVIPKFPAQHQNRTTATTTASTSTATSFQFSSGATSVPLYTKPAVLSFTPAALPMSLSPSAQVPKLGGGKMKSARNTGHYTRNDEEEEEEVVNPLPEVTSSVPLSLPDGKALPSFSFGAKLPTSIPSDRSSKFELTQVKASDVTKNNFKFSVPATKSSSSSLPPRESLDTKSPSNTTFSFSQPCPVTKSSSTSKSEAINSQSEKLSKSSESKTDNLLTKFAPPIGSWSCSSCLVNNRASDNMCVACTAARPAKNPLSVNSSSPNNDLLSKFALPSGSWTCDTCLVSNKACDKKCIACQTAKPSVKPSVSSRKTEGGASDLQVMFAAPAGSWSCDSCLVTNKASDTKCVACQSSKPGTRTEDKQSVPFESSDDLAKKFAPPSGSWACDTCMLSNKADLDKCVACETAKPGAKPASFIKPAPLIPSDNNLAKKFAPASDSWECETCMLSNKGDVDKCVACQTPKPGATPSVFTSQNNTSFTKSPFQFGAGPSMDAKAVEPQTSGFKFGRSTESNSGGTGFTFGSTSETSESKSSSSALSNTSGFKFVGASTNSKESGSGGTGFKFVNTSGASSESKSSPFLFGSSVNNSSETKTGLQAGSGVEQGSKEVEKPKSIAAAAAEGFLKVPGMSEPAKMGAIAFGGSQSIADAAKAGMLKVPTAGEKKGESPVPPNVNLFTNAPGTASSNLLAAPGGVPAALSSSTSTVPTLQVESKASSSTPFIFGGAVSSSNTNSTGSSLVTPTSTTLQPTKPAPTGIPPSAASFTFGAANSTKEGSSAQPAFSFTPSVGFTAAAPSAVPSQGAVPTTVPTTASAAGFSFSTGSGASADSSTKAPGASFVFGAGPVTFGGVGVTPTAGSTAPIGFGGGAVNTTSANAAPAAGNNALLGGVSVTATTASAAPGFGLPSATSSANKPFSFNVGTAVSSSATSNTGFGSFNFAAGSAQPAATNQATNQSFVFGAASQGADETMEADNNPASQLGFNTGGAAAGSMFGGQPGVSAAGAFGASTGFGATSTNTGGFNFNQGPSVPGASGGFQFGSQPSAGAGSFVFGAGSSTPAAFGANSSQTPAASVPAPSGGFSFNAGGNVPGVGSGFNFGTGGQPSFAGGTGDANSGIAGRKFKRAVRRNKQR